jgi:hypothetical protein
MVGVIAIAVAAGCRGRGRHLRAAAATSPETAQEVQPVGETRGYLYGRITTVDGTLYEGRLRWGHAEEAFWGDYFNGFKHENPWLAQVPPGRVPKTRHPIQIFGFEIGERETERDVSRPLMARFGDIARIEAHGKEVRVTLKSGAAFDVDRFEASDFDDGVRVWDERRGAVNLDSLRISAIELLPAPALGAAPTRLQGTVRTRQGDFTGFVQWGREACVGSDELEGSISDREIKLRFDTIRSIERRSREGALVMLGDGREIALSDVGNAERGMYVDDPRYGRVLVSWDAFERVDFSAGGSGPAYGDFPPGRPLAGSVTSRDGQRFAGRLVYDLDESETTETLDAPSEGVDYTIPLGLVASIALPGREAADARRARVTLVGGETLQLERSGDLGGGNAGMLVFVAGHPTPEYLPWTDVERIDLDRPPAMYPPLGGR